MASNRSGLSLTERELEWLKAYMRQPINPYCHPAWDWRGEEAAKAYFAWELLHGTDVEKLKQDPYWKYMEE